jgi:hypothetical protein
MRPFNEDGTWGEKQKKEYVLDENGNKIYDKRKRTYKCRTVQTTDWNSREKAEEWRTEWEKFINSSLTEKDIIEKVDHRSFERQAELIDIHFRFNVAIAYAACRLFLLSQQQKKI